MKIAGIGLIFAGGRGINKFDEALRNEWVPPFQTGSQNTIPAYRIPDEYIIDSTLFKKIRRADRFSKMTVISACDSVADSGISFDSNKTSIGVIVSTTFGPHVTTFRFLDDIIDYGHANVSPTIFSHSVHNAAASYISSVLDIRGPTITLTNFKSPFHQALMLADAWLKEGRCDYVLAGSTDECGTIMEYISSKKLKIAGDGKIRPFNFSDSPSAVPGEGSAFFILTQNECRNKYCEVTVVSTYNDTLNGDKPDILILDADGMVADETQYKNNLIPEVYTASYTPIFGSMMTGSAFSCVAASLMINKQIRYANPVFDNPYDIKLCIKNEPAAIKSIYCIKNDCSKEKSIIKLRR